MSEVRSATVKGARAQLPLLQCGGYKLCGHLGHVFRGQHSSRHLTYTLMLLRNVHTTSSNSENYTLQFLPAGSCMTIGKSKFQSVSQSELFHGPALRSPLR